MKQKKKISRKVISYVLAFVMVFSTLTGIVPGLSVTANAATDPVPYIYYTNNVSTEGTCTDYTIVATDTTTWGTAENTTWYVVSGEVTISSRVTVNGTVNLILRDGAKMTVNGGIGLDNGNTLNIYPETEDGTGELNANASSNYCPGIGGTHITGGYSVACGTLTIHGGVIKAQGAENGPGIGNSGQGALKGIQAAGTVIIYAGNVTATGGEYGSAGIGGGWAGTGGCNVEIYGGTVLANVGTSPNGAQGIGYAGGNVTKYPGTLKIGDRVKVYSDAAGATEIAAGPQDNVESRTNTMFVKKVKLAQTVTPPTAATDLTYQKDQAQALLTEGASVSEGNGNTEATIQYSLTPDDDTSWVADYTDVKATNAGIHKVYYRVAGNDTYDDFVSSDEQAISVTIAKADPATPTGITAKYCDNTGEIDLPKGWTWQDDWYFFYNVGKDTCKANFAGDNNYNAKTDVDITVTVERADAAISYEKTEVSVEYGAELSQNQITNPGDADPTFTSTNKSVATVSETGYVTIKGIGETTITATIEDNEHYHYTTTQASYKLTVNPVTTEITTVPIAAGLTFGQKLSESKLTGGKAVLHGKWAVDGTFAWKEPDTVPNASDSGEYVVVFTPDNANYSTAECNVKLTVKKASPTVTAPTAKTLNYTGSPVSLVNAGSTGDGTLYYALGENGTTAPDFDGASDTADKKWNTAIPTATNVGTYYVWYKVVGDKNHNDLEPECVKVTIAEEKKQDEPVKPETPAKTVDMYRLYNPNSGEHFYTANAAEKDNLVSLGWKYEGIGWKAPATSNTPVYRVYNPNAGDHHYTTNKAERDNLISVGWKDEGIGWYSDDAQSLPIFRQYNPNAVAGAHNFTSSKGENDWLVSVGWKGEGIGWYGVK